MMNQRYKCIYTGLVLHCILYTVTFVHINFLQSPRDHNSPNVTAIASSSSSIKSNKEGEAEPDIRGVCACVCVVSLLNNLSHIHIIISSTFHYSHSHCHTIRSPSVFHMAQCMHSLVELIESSAVTDVITNTPT